MVRNLKLYDVQFGWKEVESVFLIDEKHIKIISIRRIYLTTEMSVIYGYSMMKITYAKYIYSLTE